MAGASQGRADDDHAPSELDANQAYAVLVRGHRNVHPQCSNPGLASSLSDPERVQKTMVAQEVEMADNQVQPGPKRLTGRRRLQCSYLKTLVLKPLQAPKHR